jgi:hypothetical protein
VKLSIRRDPKSGTIGKQKYTLSIRAQLSEAETTWVRANKLEGEMLLYFEGTTADQYGSAGAMLRIMRDVDLTVGKLIEGVTLTCDNLGQLLGVEAQVLEATQNLQRYLVVAATFGKETVVDLDAVIRPEGGRR